MGVINTIIIIMIIMVITITIMIFFFFLILNNIINTHLDRKKANTEIFNINEL